MPFNSTMAMSHIEGVSDSSRARELYRYYQPTGVPLERHEACFEDPPSSETPQPSNHDPLSSTHDDPRIESDITSTKISSPDTALNAFAQLTSWRIGSQRAMISVIDRATQYFIAESTRTVDLVDPTKHAPGDGLWMGCDSVSKAGRLCERTISLPPAPPGDYPVFIVSDLLKDERFKDLPFVSGPPFLKFYAGTPLITKRGIPIGSLFVVDNRARTGLSKEEIHFMGTMAATVMRHMEITREVEEHRRGMKMSRGLASFVEGRSELQEDELDNDDEGATIAGQFEEERPFGRTRPGSVRLSVADSISGSVSSVERKEKEYSSSMVETEQAILSSTLDGGKTSAAGVQPSQNSISVDSLAVSASEDASPSVAESKVRPDVTTGQEENSFSGLSMSISSPKAESPGEHKISGANIHVDEESLTTRSIFSRASNLIREAFEVDGGAVFYDAQKTFGSEYSQNNAVPKTTSSPLAEEFASNDLNPIEEITPQGLKENPFSQPQMENISVPSRSSIQPEKVVELLGFSTPGAASIHEDPLPGPNVFSPFGERSLHNLLKRYPRGKLWTFDEDGSISSSEEDKKLKLLRLSATPSDSPRHTVYKQRKRARTVAEARFLLRHFPGVRQLLFVPLWDAGRSRWLSGCFTWSNEPTRVLSKQSELAFLSAFCNSVMAECSRLDTEVADQKKSDFIGSISHELRSPLHGILASAEFLGEELTEGFARGLVETIDSCGRTLLDTINHILDFSKINNFEKNWRRSRRAGSSRLPGHHNAKASNGVTIGPSQHSDLPMINLFAEVDISTITEEVVEGVFAGHVFQNSTASSFDMVPNTREKMLDPRHTSTMLGDNNFNSHAKDVSVILDIPVDNYSFTTQPGAFRRVIMNLLGNALKYTSHGYVCVKLETTPMEDWQQAGHGETIARSMVTLTVTDTGKGISNEFLRSKLFTPFAQENSLSSGTGLGLSIVRSIVALLEGDIQIKSQLGSGTEVKITLPLLRSIPKTTDSNGSGSTQKSTNSMVREPDASILQLRAQIVGQKVALVGFDVDNPNTLVAEAAQYLKTSTTKFVTDWYGIEVVPDSAAANIIIIDEDAAAKASQLAKTRVFARPRPIVLVLCSQTSRYERNTAVPEMIENLGYISKPIGPLKLARALLTCLNNRTITPGITPGEAPVVRSPDLSTTFEELHMSTRGGEVLDNSRMAAGTNNARQAIESPTPTANIEKYEYFPFPTDRPAISKNKSMPADQHDIGALTKNSKTNVASVVLSNMENKAAPSPDLNGVHSEKPSPRLLLVDDNKINLRLLRTYMLKRKYTLVDEAENGLEAVQAVQKQPEGYDIIFMDVSMPVLDGFGATRQIRRLEGQRRHDAAADNKDAGKPALIIALTGLASASDQQEAFSSGLDLFLTKPVSFKEVGKLLDNWEANTGREAERDGT